MSHTPDPILAASVRSALATLPGFDPDPAGCSDFLARTLAGPMLCSVRPCQTDAKCAILCRFLDPFRASQHLGTTWGLHRLRPNGKWNHDPDSLDPLVIVSDFVREIEPLLVPPELEVVSVVEQDPLAEIVVESMGNQWRLRIEACWSQWMTSLAKSTAGSSGNTYVHRAYYDSREEAAIALTRAFRADVMVVVQVHALARLNGP